MAQRLLLTFHMKSLSTFLNNNFDWFFGVKSVAKVIPINQKYRKLLLDEINTVNQSHLASYTPWMSYHSKRDYLSDFYEYSFKDILNLPKVRQQSFVKSLSVGNSQCLDLGLDEGMIIQFDHFNTENYFIFMHKFDTVLRRLERLMPWLRTINDNVVMDIIPVVTDQFERVGLSSHDLKGVMFFKLLDGGSEVADLQLFVDYCHELAHQNLMIYLTADPILTSSQTSLIYSSIRKEARHAIRTFHGAAALSYEFLALFLLLNESGDLTLLQEAYLKEELKSVHVMLKETIASLESNCTFTDLGSEILKEYKSISTLY